MVRPHEIEGREIVLAVIKSRTAPDDLLELDHRIDRPQQHDVANVAGVHAGRELLRGGQNTENSFLVILKISQVLFSQSTIIGRHPLAVIRGSAVLRLADQIQHHQRVRLVRAKDQRFFLLVDLWHEDFNPLFLPIPDLDATEEVLYQGQANDACCYALDD
jgi:hypothetical protein